MIAVNVVKETVTVELGEGNTVDCTAQQIMDVRSRVAAEAQSRNAAGITPAAQYGLATLDHADELLAGDDPHVLHGLEDIHDAPSRAPRPAAPKPAPVRADTALGESVMHALRPTPSSQPSQHQRGRSDQGRADGVRAERPQAASQGGAVRAPQSMQPETADDAAAQQARRRKRRKRGGK